MILYKVHNAGVSAAGLLRAAVGGSAAVCDACGQLERRGGHLTHTRGPVQCEQGPTLGVGQGAGGHRVLGAHPCREWGTSVQAVVPSGCTGRT